LKARSIQCRLDLDEVALLAVTVEVEEEADESVANTSDGFAHINDQESARC
jgi:hypothetical protein